MTYRKFSNIFILFFITSSLLAQNYSYNGTQFVDETKTYFTKPIKWNGKDILTFCAIGVTSYGLMHFDEDVKNYALKDNEENNALIYDIARTFGEPYFSPILGAIIFMSGSVSQNDVNKRLGFEILQSVVYSGFTTTFVKISFGRSRPYQNKGSFDFNPFSALSDSELSLPSGHTTASFALFTTLSLNSKSDVLKVIYFVPAIFTGVSRIVHNKHWLSDVFLGATIGYFTAKYVHSLHNKTEFEEAAIPLQTDLVNIAIPLF